MTKEEIYNQYAIEQGYEDFNHLILDDMFEGDLKNTIRTINAVTDLIQEELKKKISKDKYPFTQSILNTKNIK